MFTHSHGCILWTRPLDANQVQDGEVILPPELQDVEGLTLRVPDGSFVKPDRLVGLKTWMKKNVQVGDRIFFYIPSRSTSVDLVTKSRMFVALTKNTGTILRFRPSQIHDLPPDDRPVTVVTPDGRVLAGKFRRNPQNPYFGGVQVRRWIIKRCPDTNRRDTHMCELVRDSVYFIETNEDVAGAIDAVERTVKDRAPRVTSPEDAWEDLASVANTFRAATPKIRASIAKRYETDPRLSRLVKDCFGYACQVDGCPGLSGVEGKNFVEAHHLEHLSKGGANDPYNLCVLCANHHRLLHRDKKARVATRRGDDVLVRHSTGTFWIRRDLSRLRNI